MVEFAGPRTRRRVSKFCTGTQGRLKVICRLHHSHQRSGLFVVASLLGEEMFCLASWLVSCLCFRPAAQRREGMRGALLRL